MANVDYTTLILAAINAAPGLATAIHNFVQTNPMKQGEADDAYVARLNAETLAMGQDTTEANRIAGAP